MFYETGLDYDTNLQQMMLGLKLVYAAEFQYVKGTAVSLSIWELARLHHRSLCNTESKYIVTSFLTNRKYLFFNILQCAFASQCIKMLLHGL